MSRPPNLPSHPGPPASYSPYSAPYVQQSRPETTFPAQSVQPRDPTGSQSNAQQLPSLRTLLEPELLENRSNDSPSRSNTGYYMHGGASRFGSSSPTLKRRHDSDGYTHGHSQHNAMASQTPHIHRQPYSATTTDNHSIVSSTPGSAFSASHVELQRRASFAQASHFEHSGRGFRPSSTASDPALRHGEFPTQDELNEAGRPVRRRIDGTSRAPVKSSRCIGQRDMPGEGLCYIYEDGTYCRAIIDGEAVNPSWGITKAGKPRKRLAQACLTCREKKIKCEPGYPKCQQCAKSQRVCRGGINQASISNASGETSPSSSAPMYKKSSSEVLHSAVPSDRNRAPAELRESSGKVETWHTRTPFKPRNFQSASSGPTRDMSIHSIDSDWSGSGNEQGMGDPRRGSYQDQMALQWEQDPYETDPRLTKHLLDLYFLHAGRATYGMFPRRAFVSWAERSHVKSQDQLMALYAVLALGSLFSEDPEKRALGKRFAGVASYAAEKRFGRFTLQLCQTRLMLALYYFARGKSQEAWDFCGAGLRAISALKLNTEEGIIDLGENTPDLDYGFDRWTFEECCRRTFWSGLLMDVSFDVTKEVASIDSTPPQRYNGFFGGTMFVISMEDTYVRLPVPADMYEASSPCEAPYFEDDVLLNRPSSSPTLGHMAYLCLISAIWGEVLTFTGRSVRRPHGYERHYEAFYARTQEKLDAWLAMLPHYLQYSTQNLDNSILEGTAGTFLSLHALYHGAVIRLNRHVRLESLSNDKVQRNIGQSFRSASSFLSIMHALAPINRRQRLPQNAPSDFIFSTPFPGYALMLSIDVLASAGTYSTLPNLIESIGISMTCIDELADFWASARTQQKAIATRIKQLTDILHQESQVTRNGTYGQFWKIQDSLEVAFGNDDTVYRADDTTLFDILAQITNRQ